MLANAMSQPAPTELAFSGKALGVKALSWAWQHRTKTPDIAGMARCDNPLDQFTV